MAGKRGRRGPSADSKELALLKRDKVNAELNQKSAQLLADIMKAAAEKKPQEELTAVVLEGLKSIIQYTIVDLDVRRASTLMVLDSIGIKLPESVSDNGDEEEEEE